MPSPAAKPSAQRARAPSRPEAPPSSTVEVTAPSAVTTTASPSTAAWIDGMGPPADGAPNTCTPSPVPGSTASSPSPQNASSGAVRSGR
jgi:hypothetical protein